MHADMHRTASDSVVCRILHVHLWCNINLAYLYNMGYYSLASAVCHILYLVWYHCMKPSWKSVVQYFGLAYLDYMGNYTVASSLPYVTLSCEFVVQYFDLAYLYYMGYYTVASSLLFVTLISAFLSTAELCKTQQELFKSVDRQRLIPLVQNGRIRWGHCLASYIAVSISDI